MKLTPIYNPSQHENKIYKLWETNQAFKPRKTSHKESFSLVVPPPNANGNLHIGHALTFALQDIIIRYQRMQGKATLFLPGADHAGFETQVVFERELAKLGKSRLDYSREELYAKIWDFVDQNKTTYQTQFRRLGASVDWNYFTYTLDTKIISRANLTFKKMWDDGLIYRGERLVNYCTFHGTAFADIEVEHKEVVGHLWEISYPLTDGSGEVVVATTRPETMLGDTAVAVHPNDKKLVKLVGKTVNLPLTNRQIPIIADEMVNMNFGTGAVKITPAHDPNDFETGERHDLPKISIIGLDGLMTSEAGELYRGLTITEARNKIISDLKIAGNLKNTSAYSHSVGHCYKCDTVIQPLLREQWFIDMEPLAKKAIQALKNNQITFYPNQKKAQLITYLEGLRDWNISRQIAWGIPIPAFVNLDNPDDWIYDTRTNKEFIEVNGHKYRRDPDVFDTWFSSGQWPFATLDYPDSETYKQFYPLSLMETGVDIMAPWVSRMIMLGLYITNSIPFKAVYLHGMVLDEYGSKMSKSKGNVVNPMEIINEYGSDALRMGLITGQTAGNNQPFTIAKVVGARNFCNKLWNIARYIQSKHNLQENLDSIQANQDTPETSLTDEELAIATKNSSKVGCGNQNGLGKAGILHKSSKPSPDYAGLPRPETIADHWVLCVLQHSITEISELLSEYRLSEAYVVVYHTIWNEVADWYIEASKLKTGEGMLKFVLETILKISHPFAPFVTETTWQSLSWQKGALLINAEWPTVPAFDKDKSAEFNKLKEIIIEVRQLTKSLKLSHPTLMFDRSELVANNTQLLTKLAGIGGTEQGTKPDGIRLISAEAWLSVDQKHLKAYKKELSAKIKQTSATISNLQKRLSNKAYVAQAPEHVVNQTHGQLELAKANLIALNTDQIRFSKL